MNRKLKRALELCLGTCGCCKHFYFFEQYCDKNREEVKGSDPTCDDYEMWKMEKEDGRK